jgi:hypothetical protein
MKTTIAQLTTTNQMRKLFISLYVLATSVKRSIPPYLQHAIPPDSRRIITQKLYLFKITIYKSNKNNSHQFSKQVWCTSVNYNRSSNYNCISLLSIQSKDFLRQQQTLELINRKKRGFNISNLLINETGCSSGTI